MDRKKLEEFANINSHWKFVFSNPFVFSDGSRMHPWYKNNRQEILTSKDPLCIKIQKDFNEYKIISEERERVVRDNSMRATKVKKKTFEEFLEIEDLSKFEYGSDVTFKNGMLACKWFIENQIYIKSSKDPICIEIVKQYNKKKKIDLIKQRIIYKRRKKEFISISDVYKFEEKSDVVFKDGLNTGSWFNINKSEIFKYYDEDDAIIMRQYDEFIDFCNLRKEFINNDSKTKFDYTSSDRFYSGAPTYIWWEYYKDRILKSKNEDDLILQKQFNESLEKEALLKKK